MPALAPLSGFAPAPALAPLFTRDASGLYGVRTNIVAEDNGIWTMAETKADSNLDLVYIKTRNTGSGKVEVHVASGDSGWSDLTYHSASAFTPEDNGVWLMADMDGDHRADLVYIKTRNTASGRVEVHSASASSNYRTMTVATASLFTAEENGVWTMYDIDGDFLPDLVYIKDSHTPGNTEVHAASQSSNFQQQIVATPAGFPQMAGRWQMCRAWQSSQYLAWTGNNLSTGQMEVLLGSKNSNYRSLQTLSTPFSNNSPGLFMLANPSYDWGLASSINKRYPNNWGKLSLYNIRNTNTVSGKVELSVYDLPL